MPAGAPCPDPSLLRTRGDDPAGSLYIPNPNGVVCSAHAEMIPQLTQLSAGNPSLLRTRGDDPDIQNTWNSFYQSAPHTRR